MSHPDMTSDPFELADVAAKLWRNGLSAVEEDLARASGPLAGVLLRELARAAPLLTRAESEQELKNALVLRLTGVPLPASMLPGTGLTSRWPMADRPAPDLARVLDGEEGDARPCTWSPDGRWLVSINSGTRAGEHNAVQLWDARTWRRGPTLDHGPGWPNRVHNYAVPLPGDWLATCAAGVVWIWDVESGQLRGMFEGWLTAAAPNGDWLAIDESRTGDGDRITFYRMPSGEPMEAPVDARYPGAVMRGVSEAVAYWTVVVDAGLLRVVELPGGQVRHEFAVGGDIGDVEKFALSPDGSWLAAEIDTRTRVWDTATGDVRETFECGLGPVHAVAPDGSWIAATPGGTQAVLLDVTGSRSTPLLLGEHNRGVRSCAISPDGERLAVGCEDGTIWLWDVDAEVVEHRADPRRTPLSSCAASPDGSWVATTDDDWRGRIVIWDVATGRQRRAFGSGYHRSCVVAPDGTWLATAAVDAVLIWEVATGRLRRRIDCPVRSGEVLCSAARNHIGDLAVAPDGTWLAAACEDGTVRLLDVVTGQTRDVLEHAGITGRMLSCAIAANAGRLACSGLHGTVVHDLASGWVRSEDSVSDKLDFSPDGSLLAGDQGSAIRVWEAATGETRYVLRGHTEPVRAFRWSPDGSRLASVADRTVRIWAAGGEIETTVRLYASPTACCWLPNGRSLVVTSQQGLHVFDLANTPPTSSESTVDSAGGVKPVTGP